MLPPAHRDTYSRRMSLDASTLPAVFSGLQRPWVIAHRGGPDQWPENTLEAFRQATADGFPFLETDLRRTRDGVLVTLHDPTLDRTTDGRGPVNARTFEQVQRLDAAWHFAPHRGHPLRGAEVRIPSFEAVARALPGARFIVDLKEPGLEEPLAALIRSRDLADRVLVGSFDDDRLQRFRALTGGRVATCAGRREIVGSWMWSRIGRRIAPRPEPFVIPRRFRGVPIADGRFVRAAHRANRPVIVWTINDPALARSLVSLGVDGLVTDRPASVQSAIQL